MGDDKEEDVDVSEEKKEDTTNKKGKKGEPTKTRRLYRKKREG